MSEDKDITYLAALIVSLALSLPLTHLARYVGGRFRIYDEPNGRRVNRQRVPRLGGVAITLAFLGAITAVFFFPSTSFLFEEFLYGSLPAILVGALAVMIVGLWDDIFFLRARYKLLLQILVATGVYFLGIQIHAVELPFMGVFHLGDYALPITVLWIVGVMNAVNLIDGVDGLCAATVLAAALAFLVLAMLINFPLAMIFALALGGAILGFLVFNFAPATIFMGDSGSYFLGFIVATLSVVLTMRIEGGVFSLTPVLILAVPLVDTTHAIFRRLSNRQPLGAPDRGHLHHRLLAQNYSPRRISLVGFYFSAAIAACGVILATGSPQHVALALAIAVLLIGVLLRISGISSLETLKGSPVSDYADICKADMLRQHLPDFYVQIMAETDWSRARRILDDFSRKVDLHAASIRIGNNGDSQSVWDWQRTNLTPISRRGKRIAGVYDIYAGDERIGEWHLSWDTELDTIARETDVLLSVTASVIGKVYAESVPKKGIATGT